MDLETIALVVDEHARVPAADRNGGRLWAVRVETDDTGAERVDVQLVTEGEARGLCRGLCPPAGLRAIAISSGVWSSPLEGAEPYYQRPSLHPDRRRAHLTVIVGGEKGEDISVLRYADDEPTILRDGCGLVHEELQDCWFRRADAA